MSLPTGYSREQSGTGTAWSVYPRTFSRYGFQVMGTHTFVGAPGTYLGTQVYYSEASHCDDGF